MLSKLSHIVSNTLRAHLHYHNGFYWLRDPGKACIPEDLNDFIAALPGPTVISLTGKQDIQRVVITLLQGDQPLGVTLLHRYLIEEAVPTYSLTFIIMSVHAASLGALFSHSQVPGHRNIERCFHAPYAGEQGQLAAHLRDLLIDTHPEYILDIHNSSRACVSFALAMTNDIKTQYLAAAFTRYLVVGSPQEGALTDLQLDSPIVAIIFSDQDIVVPNDCYTRFVDVLEKPVETSASGRDLQFLTTPYRLEVRSGASLAFADRPVFGMNVTLRHDLATLCAQDCTAGEPLGWVDHNQLDHFRLGRHDEQHAVQDFFDASSQRLIVRHPMRVVMAASSPQEAKNDFILLFCAKET